jgi:hypothetical protein
MASSAYKAGFTCGSCDIDLQRKIVLSEIASLKQILKQSDLSDCSLRKLESAHMRVCSAICKRKVKRMFGRILMFGFGHSN